MKSVEVKINVYEVGDILDVSSVSPRHRKSTLSDAKKVLIIETKQLKDGRYHYKCVTDKALSTSITPDELHGEKYIDHIDLSFLI